MRVANGAADLLRVVASADVGDAVAPALLQSFARRASNVEATLGIATIERDAGAPVGATGRRRPRPGARRPGGAGLVSEPLLRYRLLFVAGSDHRLRTARSCRRCGALRDEEWLVDPTATDPDSDARVGCSPGSACPRRTSACSPTQPLPGRRRRRQRHRARDRAAVDPRPPPRRRPAAPSTACRSRCVAREHAARRSPAAPSPAACTASCRPPTPRRRCTAPTAASRLRSSARRSTSPSGADGPPAAESGLDPKSRPDLAAKSTGEPRRTVGGRDRDTPLVPSPRSRRGAGHRPSSDPSVSRGRAPCSHPSRPPACSAPPAARSASRSTSATACPATASSACPTRRAASRATGCGPP